jgi:hypothetical protein
MSMDAVVADEVTASMVKASIDALMNATVNKVTGEMIDYLTEVLTRYRARTGESAFDANYLDGFEDAIFTICNEFV